LEYERCSLSLTMFDTPVSPDLEKILVGFIKEETSRFNIKKCIIGLSGGIDSSLAAYLTQKAVGSSNLTGILLPYKTSSPDSIDDALLVAKKLNIKTIKIDVSPGVDAFIADKDMDKLRKGNVIARMRMIALYDFSQKVGGFVIGTGNKTELLLGYTTLYGDSACAINPLGDLYKTQVWQLSKLMNIPKKIISKKPSADLWIGQSDEGEMGFKYDVVDRLLYLMVDMRYSDEELVNSGFHPDFIDRVKKIIRKNQFKRLPPIIAKVSNRTINVDFRYNRDMYS
jgi:NAD+ synthase